MLWIQLVSSACLFAGSRPALNYFVNNAMEMVPLKHVLNNKVEVYHRLPFKIWDNYKDTEQNLKSESNICKFCYNVV